MTANLAFFPCEEGWVLLRFVLIFLSLFRVGSLPWGSWAKKGFA